ncbi:peptide chain release factor N(5)-glutamine methyltransferase [Candidatus Cyanaurora vandensis]|uniref:peptide chain release factor N(5)-glutamine methyltransferase n=1 Tax=Candidatus Cyanaurora vandensis TaxID=2714958 RepID=UPI00257A2D87|nr:peptide chain release factor N(5)-glutamine methyltransferase [Candidatus Cyanaurora vandensis]
MKLPNPETFQNWRQQSRRAALVQEIDPIEVDRLIQGVTDLGRLEWTEPTLAPYLSRLESLWQRRVLERVPLQYLLGEVGWRDFTLVVRPGVLIPRPETELLVDYVVQALQGTTPERIVDVGTGSGCLAVGLARALPGVQVLAVDVDPQCLVVAQENSQRLGLTTIELKLGSWLEPITGLVDAVVSNPPYIPQAQLAELAPEVRDHEPWLALVGGTDGLDAFRELVSQAPRVLKSGGLWAVEVMQGQAAQVMTLLHQAGYQEITGQPDLECNLRFVLARAPSAAQYHNLGES